MSDKKDKNSLTPVNIIGIVLDSATQAPVIILQTEAEGDDEKSKAAQVQLPIWVGIAEATAIATTLKKLELTRPLTHDLLSTVFDQLDVSVEQAVITELKDSTYYAEIVLSVGERAIILDSRPSDAIAMAVRHEVPIFVSESVLEQARKDQSKMNITDVSKDLTTEEPKEGPAKIVDLRYVDKSEWSDILEKLSKKDFKYKA